MYTFVRQHYHKQKQVIAIPAAAVHDSFAHEYSDSQMLEWKRKVWRKTVISFLLFDFDTHI